MRQFVELNLSPDIQAKRTICKQLRVLANEHTSIHWPFSRWETHLVDDGYDEKRTKDKDGNVRVEKVVHKSEVKVEVFYTNGTIIIKSKDSAPEHSRGFDITMQYHDGHGDAIKPKTREPLHLVGQMASMPPSHFELTNDFTLTTGLKKLFDLGASVLQAGVPKLLEAEQAYRAQTMENEMAANAILGDSFLYELTRHQCIVSAWWTTGARCCSTRASRGAVFACYASRTNITRSNGIYVAVFTHGALKTRHSKS